MYFYSYKINQHEQNLLLEMRYAALLCFRNGTWTNAVNSLNNF